MKMEAQHATNEILRPIQPLTLVNQYTCIHMICITWGLLFKQIGLSSKAFRDSLCKKREARSEWSEK
jgi:hypothetical protein